jgi:pimeloyl-ACP methyl ester carboxylesterase
MPTVTSKDGTKIAFEKVGSGPAVILVNGAMSYRRAFDTTLEDLAELLSKDFTVYDYDRRGRGESTDNTDVKSFIKEREIEDIQALIKDAGGEAMVVGFSSGGCVTLETTAVTPGVTKAFVYEVPFIVDDSRETFEGQTHSVDPKVLAPVIIEFFKK